MKSKTKRITRALAREAGAVSVVEATFVFPVMFFVLFFLIFFGNAFYIKAVVHDYVAEAAIKGAACVADPFYEGILDNGAPDNSVKIEPYRYISSGMDTIESDITAELKNNIKKNAGFFPGMSPVISANNGSISTFDNKVLYSTFIVEINFKIKFPWRFLGAESPTVLELQSRAEEPVGDQAEFIRNVDMVIDMIEGNKIVKNIQDAFGKVRSFIEQFAGVS